MDSEVVAVAASPCSRSRGHGGFHGLQAESIVDTLRGPVRKGENVMPALVDASLARCTLGEQVQAMADVYGRYSGGPEW